MLSGRNGHGVPPAAEHCGEDVRPRCYQGHASRAGSQFCETCGALLPAEPAVAPASPLVTGLVTTGLVTTGPVTTGPVTEYTSGSFRDFLARGDEAAGDDSVLTTPAAAGAAAAVPAATLWRAAKWRSGTLTMALGTAVLIAVAVVGGRTLLHHRAGQQAQGSRPLGITPTAQASVPPTAPPSAAPTAPASAAPTAPASAAPSPSPTPPPAVAAAPQAAPIDQQAPRNGTLDHHQGRLPAQYHPLSGWPFVLHGPGIGQFHGIPRGILPGHGLAGRPLQQFGGFHRP